MKKLLLLFSLFLMMMPVTRASHIIGGEITWECVTTGPAANRGKFIFTVKKYRTCKQGAATGIGASQIQNPLGAAIPTSWVSQGDISPPCYDPIQELDCFGSVTQKADAIEEFIFKSAPVTLVGTPAATGSVFYVSDCCRPTGITNSSSTGTFVWRCIMYPFTTSTGTYNVGTFAKPNCYDNSPQFAERPAAIICTDYLFTYNHNAVDNDLDSLDYKWAPSWQGVNNSIVYTAGYTFATPLPNPIPPNNLSNVSATVNPQTGEISFLSYNAGRFYTNIQVDAYKCGQLVASIFREIPVNLLSCPPLPPPFPPNTVNTPPNVSLTYKTVPTTNLNVTVLAGEEVEFEVAAIDLDFLPGFVQQSVRMRPTGSQFGTQFGDTSAGCRYPPCAILDTTAAPLGSYIRPDNEWVKVTQLSSDFYWRTDCNHLARSVNAFGISNCFTRSNTYTFVFKILDDYCPAPGANFVTASITVNAPDPLDPPIIKCLSVANNGDVSLSWNIPVPAALDSNNSFRKYIIFRSTKRDTNQYTPIDTILNINTSSYVDVGANAHTTPKHYYIMGVSSCNDASQLIWTDTITTMTLTAQARAAGDSVFLSWPHFVRGGSFPAKTTGAYNVYEIYQGDTTLISTQTSNVYTNAVTTCSGGSKCFPSAITYFVTVVDTTAIWGCTSFSNFKQLNLGDNTPPVAPNIKVATISPLGGTQLSWSPSIDCDVEQYYIWENGVIIDSVAATDSSYFRAFPSSTNIGHPALTYNVSGIDSCGNKGNPGLDHITIQASIGDVSRCATDKRISVTVTAYSGWPVTKYILFADTGTGPFAVDSVDPTAVTFPYVFNDTSVNSAFYTYFIRAYDGSGIVAQSSADTLSMSVVTNYVVDPPEIKCIRKEANGDVVIEWEVPPSPDNNFDSYRIYHSTDGTNFSVIDSIVGNSRSDNQALDSSTYRHINAGPGQHYYRVYSRSGCDGFKLSSASNTIETIGLAVNATASNVNQLVWNFTPISSSGAANIMKDYPVGTGFIVAASLPNTASTFNDTINACDDSAHYQIIIPDLSEGCDSYSRIRTGLFKDQEPPAKQFLDSVTVTNDSSTSMGWSANPSQDVVLYYVIRRTPGGGFSIIDTIPGNSTEYIDLNMKECLALVAEDSCGNNLLSEGDFNFHCPIETRVKVDRCDQSFLVQWNSYGTFVSGPEVEYTVFMSVNGAGFNPIGSTTENNYRFADPVSGNNYCFYVRATENSGSGPFTSTSDSICIVAEFLVTPEYSYLYSASVIDSNRIKVRAFVDIRADVSEYRIFRGLDSSDMKVIHTIETPKILTPSDSTIEYIDETPRTALKSYYYRIETIDPCGDPIALTNVGRSILLNVKANNDSKSNVLSWSKYDEWAGGVQNYKVYRSVQGGTPTFVATVDGDKYTYTDDVSLLTETSDGQFCYYVEANEGSPLFPGLSLPASSRSNEVCVIQYPLFYIPTAFTPGDANSPGLNDIFKPQGVFVDFENYSFEIFNRWGEKVFSTDNFEAGWNGEVEGKPAQIGAYVYIIKFQGADGTQYQREGTVTITK